MSIIEDKLDKYGLTKDRYEELMEEINSLRLMGAKIDWNALCCKYDLNMNGDSLRKSNDALGGLFTYNYMKQKFASQNSALSDDEFFKKDEQQKRELYIETQKYRDVINEYKKLQREQSRVESMEKIIEDAFEKRSQHVKYSFKDRHNTLNGDVEIVASFADAHYGSVFEIKGFKGEVLNAYNPDVFKERLGEFRNELLDFAKMNNTNKVRLVDLGDSIEGVLHLSQLQAMRSDVVDDIIDYADCIVDLVEDLTDNGLILDIYTSQGNHSDCRMLTGKKGDLPHENFEKIYTRWLKRLTRNNKNVTIHENLNGLNFFNVNGYNFLSAHGQNEKNIKNSIKEYEDTYDVKIHYFLVGHLHSKNEFEVAKGKEVIQVRSMMGINTYSQVIKKTSSAGATMFTVHKGKGKKYVNEVKFN